jgi:hypothetical protein
MMCQTAKEGPSVAAGVQETEAERALRELEGSRSEFEVYPFCGSLAFAFLPHLLVAVFLTLLLRRACRVPSCSSSPLSSELITIGLPVEVSCRATVLRFLFFSRFNSAIFFSNLST